MEKLLIEKSPPLKGEILVSGAKNAALPILCATLLTEKSVHLTNVPHLQDIGTLQRLLKSMGSSVSEEGPHTLTLTNANLHTLKAPYELVKTMRASILVLGPLLARFGEASVSLPGGCAIGDRPVDQHIKGLSAMGAEIHIEHGYIHAKASKLKGVPITMDMITVTGTENLLMAATLAQGQTVLNNAAIEPEITDLAHCLNKMGAKISGIGTHCLVIEGVQELHAASYRIMPDRIEAGTFLVAGAATFGQLTLRDTEPNCLLAVLNTLTKMGASITTGKDWIELKMTQRPQATDIRTEPYPAFPTDMQAQLMTLNAVAQGEATMVETIFENRFMHVAELNRMGAHIKVEGHSAFIKGTKELLGTPVMATDLRASASLIIAGLIARGQTVVDRIYHLDRGYENIEQKLNQVGARIQRINS